VMGEREGKRGKEGRNGTWQSGCYLQRRTRRSMADGRVSATRPCLCGRLPPDPLQGEGGGLPGGADRHRDAFAFDGADGCRCELAEESGADENGVAGVDETCGFGEWWLAGGEW
jgi:hypothetical protein